MSSDPTHDPVSYLQAMSERLMEQARDMSDLHRLLTKYNLKLAAPLPAGLPLLPDMLAPTTVPSDSAPVEVDETFQGKPAPPLPAAAERVVGMVLRELVQLYRTHDDSPYQGLLHKTRLNYDTLLMRLEKEHGPVPLADMKYNVLRGWYDKWSAGETKKSMGHAMVTMLRGLASFGVKLDIKECERLAIVLRTLRVAQVKRHKPGRMTDKQVADIMEAARDLGVASIGLAQALQHECRLRQLDCIGQWVPMREPGPDDVVHGDRKWTRGIRWEQIDENLVLRHVPSMEKKQIEMDLSKCPLVAAEIKRVGRKSSGPVIVCELTQRPWTDHDFRRQWRDVAKAAGIPDNLTNSGISRLSTKELQAGINQNATDGEPSPRLLN
jgi:hypothetical protein